MPQRRCRSPHSESGLLAPTDRLLTLHHHEYHDLNGVKQKCGGQASHALQMRGRTSEKFTNILGLMPPFIGGAKEEVWSASQGQVACNGQWRVACISNATPKLS